MKLAAKLMLVFLVAVMLLTAAGSYFSVQRAFDRFEQRQQQIARQTADAMEEKLASAWRERGREGVLDVMQELSPRDSEPFVRWVWFERTQISDGLRTKTIIHQQQLGEVTSFAVTDEQGHRQLRTYHPIELDEGPPGGLEVTDSLEPLDAEARERMKTALTSLGIMSLVCVGLVYFVGVRWVSRPLEELVAKTKRIGRGDFGGPLPVRGHDELSQLARALNEMSSQLAAQQQRIHDETVERVATLEQLRHADRLKTVGRLAAGIAHELGTPLNVMSGRAGLIASGKLSSEEITSSALAIKSETDRITAIVRQLLDFARPNEPRRSSVELSELVRQTVDLLLPLAEKRNVEIHVRPACGSRVSADRNQLQQVLTNLLVNAIQSMPDGGSVDVRLLPADTSSPPPQDFSGPGFAGVEIRDQGAGIPEELREQIFEPFFTTKDVGEGTGLGLSIAYGIVQEHGGWIDVTSQAGQGSCFTLYLPRESSQ